MTITKYKEPYIWNSAYNPIQYGFTSNRSPVMSDFINNEPVIDITDSNGRPKVKTTDLDWSKFGSYIKITNAVYSGVYKIAVEETSGGFSYLTLDAVFTTTSSGGTIGTWLDNYSVIVDLYLEKVPYSTLFEKIIRIAQRVNPDGNFLFDLHSILNKYLTYESFGNSFTGARLAALSFLRFYVAYGDQYNILGLYVNGNEPLTVDLIDGCSPSNMLTNGDFELGEDGSWTETGTGEVWTIAAGEITTTGSSKYRSQTITGTPGNRYCISFSAALTGCAESEYAVSFYLGGDDPTDQSQHYELTTVTITPGAGQGYSVCFTMPEDKTTLIFKVEQTGPACETDEVAIDEVTFTIEGGDCANILFALNSARQYNEQVGTANQLLTYTIDGTAGRKFLTTYPREYKKTIQPGEKEYLGFIAKEVVANIAKYQFYDRAGALLSTVDDTILIDNEGRYDISINDNSLTGVDHYSVTLHDDAVAVSETFYYSVDDYCRQYQYRLHWLNLLGAHDSFTFTGRAAYDTSVERLGEVKRNLWPDSFSPQSPQYEHTAINAKESLTINSGFVKKEVMDWLAVITYSKAVVLELDGQFYPVMVRTDKIGRHIDGEKKIDLEITIEFSFDKIIQTA